MDSTSIITQDTREEEQLTSIPPESASGQLTGISQENGAHAEQLNDGDDIKKIVEQEEEEEESVGHEEKENEIQNEELANDDPDKEIVIEKLDDNEDSKCSNETEVIEDKINLDERSNDDNKVVENEVKIVDVQFKTGVAIEIAKKEFANDTENPAEELQEEENKSLDDDDDFHLANEELNHDENDDIVDKELQEDEEDHATVNQGIVDEEDPDKELDDDEDRRNPQYIPKRGAFYEHDDRISSSLTEEQEVVEEEEPAPEGHEEKPIIILKKPTTEIEAPKKTPKKLWSDDGKWGHDLFKEDEQRPKSRDELLTSYGYDIRNEDGPPKARRRKRYGRGPNKYTRNWQDENAYSRTKPIAKSPKQVKENSIKDDENNDFSDRKNDFDKEEFPALLPEEEINKKPKSGENIGRDNAWGKHRPIESSVNNKIDFSEFKTEPMKVIDAIENNKTPNESTSPKHEVVRTQFFENSRYSHRKASGNSHNPPELPNSNAIRGKPKTKSVNESSLNNDIGGRPIRKTNDVPSDSRMDFNDKRTKNYTRIRENRGNFHDDRNNKDYENRSSSYNSEMITEMTGNLQKMNLDKISRNIDSEPSHQSRTKRYSSLRQQQQRTLPDGVQSDIPNSTGNLNLGQQFYDPTIQTPNYYPERSARGGSFGYVSSQSTEPPASRFVSTPQLPPRFINPPVPPSASEPPQFIPAPNPSGPPVTVPPAIGPHTQATSALLAPVPTGTPFLPTFTPSGYPQFPPPPQFAIPAQAAQAPEIFRGGVTYYDPTTQQISPRQPLQRRPKNAIPIIAPTEIGNQINHDLICSSNEADIDSTAVHVNS